MNIRLRGLSFWEHVTALWGQLFKGRRPGSDSGRVRRLDLSQLYWLENTGTDQPDVSDRTDGGVDSADFWFMRGRALIQTEQLAEARRCFERVLSREPRDPYALTYMGYCLYRLGCYEKALSNLKQASMLNPRRPEIGIIKALCLCQMCQFEEALSDFTRALRWGLESQALWNNKGYCLARLGRHREAAAAFKVALSRRGEESPEILCNAASVMVWLGGRKEALVHFERALQMNTDDHILLNNMGFCLEALGCGDKAIRCYQQALALAPGNLTYLFNHGLCLLNKQCWDQAYENLKEVVGREPGNSIAWCGLAASLVARGQEEEALECYNKAFAPVG